MKLRAYRITKTTHKSKRGAHEKTNPLNINKIICCFCLLFRLFWFLLFRWTKWLLLFFLFSFLFYFKWKHQWWVRCITKIEKFTFKFKGTTVSIRYVCIWHWVKRHGDGNRHSNVCCTCERVTRKKRWKKTVEYFTGTNDQYENKQQQRWVRSIFWLDRVYNLDIMISYEPMTVSSVCVTVLNI